MKSLLENAQAKWLDWIHEGIFVIYICSYNVIHKLKDEMGFNFPGQIKAIQQVTLARVICENVRVDSIQPAVFKVPDEGKGSNNR